MASYPGRMCALFVRTIIIVRGSTVWALQPVVLNGRWVTSAHFGALPVGSRSRSPSADDLQEAIWCPRSHCLTVPARSHPAASDGRESEGMRGLPASVAEAAGGALEGGEGGLFGGCLCSKNRDLAAAPPPLRLLWAPATDPHLSRQAGVAG